MSQVTKPEDQISSMLAERIVAGDFPSAVYLIAERGVVAFAEALGAAVVQPQRIAASLDTSYDFASLTKPLITALLCARRVDSGELTLDSLVSDFLPEFDRPDKRTISVGQLLSHNSGLPAWLALYIVTRGEPERTLAAIANTTLEYQPGSRVVYSDLGFIVLGLLLEKLSGQRLAELAQAEIFRPLNLQRSFFNPEIAMQTGIAACETGNAYERETCRNTGSDDYKNWRTELIWGQVHDGNAHFLGGASGHAGLFSTAPEALTLASQFLATQTTLLNSTTCELFRQNLTPGLNEARSFGWQLAETKDSAAGLDLPRDSFGHSGFTGTSCWIDPNRERVFILLTNRTHNRALPFVNINGVRRRFHSLANAALDNRS
ncbi:MAG TPA: serine hydrolase domain-containing protein [Pyrinomonadaceae bacterium]|jgi:CubicO group peptidase (beta-lactamase class C family)|nr:serine hydrolase domain-containing protein [Pyrinomonadaceae bacterium]